MGKLPKLLVTDIGEFVRFSSCERRLRLSLNDGSKAKELPFANRLFNALDPVLQAAGKEAEANWERQLVGNGYRDLTEGRSSTSLTELLPFLRALRPGQNAFAREISIEARLGNFTVSGRVDFALIAWEETRPRLMIVETKASRKDKTYQRIQLAAYAILLDVLLNDLDLQVNDDPVRPEEISYAVARIDELTNEPQDMTALRPLDLMNEKEDLQRLLRHDGLFERIAGADVESLDFRLDQKCDTCKFSVHCLPESARLRRLELIGLSPTVNAALRANGVHSIDHLAGLDLMSDRAGAIRGEDGFAANLEHIVEKARARCSNLPRMGEEVDWSPVIPLKNTGKGQLPVHEGPNGRLVRIYLEVGFDYVENRIGAVVAHVTTSDHEIVTPFAKDPDGKSRPVAECKEHEPVPPRSPPEEKARLRASLRNVQGTNVIQYATAPWTGEFQNDVVVERHLIQGFFTELVDAIAEQSGGRPDVPVHFYVYSRGEMAQLVEACARTGSTLLSHLRQLLGCREAREQLIFSCVGDEISNRYALGWTGHSLAVATSLSWFGQRYHWKREVAGIERNLDIDFEQDIFDFKSSLRVQPDGTWSDGDKGIPHRFEIRSRFHDTLTAPYWRAVWGTLNVDTRDGRIRSMVDRYRRASSPGVLRTYLTSRVLALRWLDERITFKNEEINKPVLNIGRLRAYNLGTANVGDAARDFLLIDHHVKLTDWLAIHMQPAAPRIQAGKTVPVRDVSLRPTPGAEPGATERMLRARLDVAPFGLTAEQMSFRSSLKEKDMVRLTPRPEDVTKAPTTNQLLRTGATCFVHSVDWEAGEIWLRILPGEADSFRLKSLTFPSERIPAPEHATIDESPSDYVGARVSGRILGGLGGHMLRWFDPITPVIPALTPPPPDALAAFATALEAWPLPVVGRALSLDQRRSVLEGLGTRVQLLLGPPGTGKTATTAASILLRCAFHHTEGQVILVGAHTHLAVDTIVERLAAYRAPLHAHLRAQGHPVPTVHIARLRDDPDEGAPDGVEVIRPEAPARALARLRQGGIVIVAGSTNNLLKFVQSLNTVATLRAQPAGFQADCLVVDEASMMVFPHFLALATLAGPATTMMLAGDHLQLAPIISHDWEREDRPPAQLYQPYRSAYEALLGLLDTGRLNGASAFRSTLNHTFRLPPVVRQLISKIYREREGIELEGRGHAGLSPDPVADLRGAMDAGHAMLLIAHTERGSRQSNAFEADLVRDVLAALSPSPPNSVAILTPHRAQRTRLQGALRDYDEMVFVIDTVERLQGGECRTIIVCGTKSDPAAIGEAAEFILNLNRANVAFSRAKERLVVICAETLLDHVPADLEDYVSAALWKDLRALCRNEIVSGERDGNRFRVLVPDDERIPGSLP